MKKVLCFNELTASFRRNIPLFLLKEGFHVTSVHTIYDAEESINHSMYNMIIVDSDSNARLLSRITTLPMLVVSNRDSFELAESFKDVKNPVFFRTDADSLDTIVNTINLGSTL